MITLEDRLAAIERLIEDFRWARAAHESMPEHQTYRALKAIAVDLRAQMPNAAEKVRRGIGGLVSAAVKQDTDVGYEPRHLIAIGQAVIGNWPVIEHALERFAKESTKESAS